MINERNVEKTKEILKSDNINLCEKKLNKIFSEVNTNASLKEALSTFTRAELDEIRKKLEVIGASSFKKAELIDVLEEKIKSSLSSIINKLSENQYKFLVKIVQNEGLLKFEEEYAEIVLSLRKYGILITAQEKGYGRYLLIPQELRPELELLVSNAANDAACTIASDLSENKVDYTKTLTPAIFTSGKIGRNEPCPCGSGKKFKKCCITSKISSII